MPDRDRGHTGPMVHPLDDAEDPADIVDGVPLRLPPARPNGSILMAAMLGLANALGMEPKNEPTEMVQPAEPLDDGLDLDFGGLPSLN